MQYTFKTTMHCQSCINKLAPLMNKELDIDEWSVEDKEGVKILKVETDLEPSQVVAIVNSAGFEAEQLKS